MFFGSSFLIDFSIHAPVKGATPGWSWSITIISFFNPRTREGCDTASPEMPNSLSRVFNPRTREGCDLADSDAFLFADIFNPRTREGCDT